MQVGFIALEARRHDSNKFPAKNAAECTRQREAANLSPCGDTTFLAMRPQTQPSRASPHWGNSKKGEEVGATLA